MMITDGKPLLWTKESTTEWVDGKVERYLADYQNSQEAQKVNFRELCSEWQWAKRSDVYTHYLHRYPAKLLPYIPIFLLSSSLASTDVVLDSFAGTGTVAVEAVTHSMNPRDCILVEINPLARLISAAKTTPVDPEILKKVSQVLFDIIEKFPTASAKIPNFPDINFWFREDAQIGLAVIQNSIKLLDVDIHIKDFFWVCFSSIIRDMSRADPKVSPPVKLSAEKFTGDNKDLVQNRIDKKELFNAFTLFKVNVNKNIVRMKRFWDACQLTGKSALVLGHDARNLTQSSYMGQGSLDTSKETQIPDNSVGMVITSPPYINAQKYTRTTKFELWWLGLVDENYLALHDYDRKLIGTENIKFADYKDLASTGNKAADILIQKIYLGNKKRAGIVSKYFADMRTSIQEMKRVLKPGGYCALVVGNNIVSKETIPNNTILAEIANEEGLSTKAMLVDEIRSRGLITKRHETAGMIADEWVILLQKPSISN